MANASQTRCAHALLTNLKRLKRSARKRSRNSEGISASVALSSTKLLTAAAASLRAGVAPWGDCAAIPTEANASTQAAATNE